MFQQGPQRAAGGRLIFENSPENWQCGFPVGNGIFGGLVYQPTDAVMELAFTHLNHWKRNFTEFPRMDFAELRAIAKKDPGSLKARLLKEVWGKDVPCFKPGGRLRIWLDDCGGSAASPLFDRKQELDLENGEIVGSYELSSKAMTRTTFAVQDCDVIVSHVCDSYRHELLVGTYLQYKQRIELSRLYDPSAEIHAIGVTEDGIAYIEVGFGETQRSILAFKVTGVPWHTPVVNGSSVSIEIDLDYLHATEPINYTVYQTMIVHEDGRGDLLAEACRILNNCAEQGFETLRHKNRQVWKNFWLQSGITLDNPALEALWYNNVYQYGVQNRGEVAPALFGLWNCERSAPWFGYYAGDINMAMCAWPLAPLNHPEMLEGLFGTIEKWLPAMEKETRELYGVENALRFPLSCGPDGRDVTPMEYRMLSCAGGFYLDYYRKVAAYYPDRQMLKERIFPVMEKSARFYVAFADRDENGKVRFGPSWAPEQGVVPAWNVANDLGLIKPLFQAVVEMDALLETHSEVAAAAAGLLAEFPDYPQLNGEFLDSDSESTRTELYHPGYMACVIPGDDVDADSELSEVAKRTLRNHLTYTHRKPLAGKIGSGCDLTWGWLFASAIRLRDREYANTLLKEIGLADFVKSNGMFAYLGGRLLHSTEEKRAAFEVPGAQPHSLLAQSGSLYGRNSTMTMPQQGGAFVFVIIESMLQSHKNEIKLFPCVLDIMGKKVSFHEMRTEGGLIASGVWENNVTKSFSIICTNEPYCGTLRLFDDNCPDELQVAPGKVLKAVEHGVYRLELEPGEKIKYPADAEMVPPVAVDPSAVKSYAADIEVKYGRSGTFY